MTAAVEAVRTGDLATLRRLLAEQPDLVRTRVDGCRTLLHVVTDWPGHFPDGARTVALLVEAGADVDARFTGGAHEETPLHWAASCDDVAVLDALLDAGADIEAPGAVIGGGSPLADAVAFGQWRAARRLVERGAAMGLEHAAALGDLDTVRRTVADGVPPERLTNAFWYACHGGQRATAEHLLAHGAQLNWVGHDGRTPLDAALAHGAPDLAAWLRAQGARPASR